MAHIGISGNSKSDLVCEGLCVHLCLSHLVGFIDDLLGDIQLSGLAVSSSYSSHVFDIFYSGNMSLSIGYEGYILQSSIYHHRMVNNCLKLKVPVDVVFSYIVVVSSLNDVILFIGSVSVHVIFYYFVVIDLDTHILSGSQRYHGSRSDGKSIFPYIVSCLFIPAKGLLDIVMGTCLSRISCILIDQVLKFLCGIRFPHVECNSVFCRISVGRIVLIQQVSDLVWAQI